VKAEDERVGDLTGQQPPQQVTERGEQRTQGKGHEEQERHGQDHGE
jgi:hypothetical protein